MQLDEGTTADVPRPPRRIEARSGASSAWSSPAATAARSCSRSAAGRALDQTGFKILASGLRQCVQDEQAAEQAGYSQAELEKLFLQLR